jgi:hypothetical protein
VTVPVPPAGCWVGMVLGQYLFVPEAALRQAALTYLEPALAKPVTEYFGAVEAIALPRAGCCAAVAALALTIDRLPVDW